LPRTTRFYELSTTERELSRQSGYQVALGSVDVPAGSQLEQQLAAGRILSGIKTSARPTPRRPKRSSTKAILDRVMYLLRAAGARATEDSGKPRVRKFDGTFRRVPNYGIVLEALRGEIHFLTSETLLTNAHRVELAAVERNNRRPDNTISVEANSDLERTLVVARLKGLVRDRPPPAGSSTAKAVITPLGAAVAAHLPKWTTDPYNLLALANGSISIRRQSARLALVRAGRATLGPTTIDGDFQADGPHWATLAEALEAAVAPAAPTQPSRATQRPAAVLARPSGWRPKSAPLPEPHLKRSPPPPAPRLRAATPHQDAVHKPPAGAGPDLVEAVMAASESIRLDRNVAFSHPVELTAPRISLRFMPIEGSHVAPRVPFEARLTGNFSSGLIRLGSSDPLVIAFKSPPDPDDLVTVWAAALLGFADLTVWPEHEIASPQTPRRSVLSAAHPRPTQGSTERAIPRVRTRYVGDHRSRVDVATIRAHLVVGHKRWLPYGQEASSEKIAEAAALGMTLAPGQTWVRAHLRAGHTAHRAISVRWDPPSSLNALLYPPRPRRSPSGRRATDH
jgi:hypothetical protein